MIGINFNTMSQNCHWKDDTVYEEHNLGNTLQLTKIQFYRNYKIDSKAKNLTKLFTISGKRDVSCWKVRENWCR